MQEATIRKLTELAGSSSTVVLGGFFAKEIDVVIAEFDRGLELGVSSKTMTDSFGKNITNRFEEASGDLLNIRRRYPLATFGYVYLVTSNVFDEPSGWERIKDMLRKLQSLTPGDQRGSYDATCLLVLDRSKRKPRLLENEVPDDLLARHLLRADFATALLSIAGFRARGSPTPLGAQRPIVRQTGGVTWPALRAASCVHGVALGRCVVR